MKNLMIVLTMSISIFACKEKERNEDTMMEPNMEEITMESKDGILKLGCYQYITDSNNIKMEVTRIEGDDVTANLFYAYAEKDKNEGTFAGNLHGDKLIGSYTFMSEGKQSVRDVAFKVEKDQIVEGFGDLNQDGTKFKDTTNIIYSSTTPWKKVDCD